MIRKFRVIRAGRASGSVRLHDLVYKYMGSDFGCASEDTRNEGVEHIAVTLNPKGGMPFFTIPLVDLVEVKP